MACRIIVPIAVISMLGLCCLTVEGVRCANDKFECGMGSSCSSDTQTCECYPGYHGSGMFQCFLIKFGSFCQLLSDPVGKTFASEPATPVKYPLPCKFLMSDFSITKPGLTCDFKVYGAQRRIQGRMAVHAYEVQLDWSMAGGKSGHFSYRQSGKLKEGKYSYVSESRDSPTGSWKKADFSTVKKTLGKRFKVYSNIVNVPKGNIYYSHFMAGDYALEVFFRPPNVNDAFDSKYMPGIAIYKTTESDFIITTNNAESSFCRSPNISDYSVVPAMEELGTDATGLFMIDTMNSAPSQNGFPLVSATCAEKSCRVILEDHEFVRCYAKDEDSNDLMLLYTDCLDAFFDTSSAAVNCEVLKAFIDEAGCTAVNPLICPTE